MKCLSTLVFVFLFTSCIPLSIKPNIDDYKLTNGKKFKRALPNQTAFVFEDPKDADEFYTYINVKFNRQHQDVEFNIPVAINGTDYFMTFYETERSTNTINLLPLAIDAALESNDITDGDTFDTLYTTRDGQWYLVIIVNDASLKDAMSESSPHKTELLQFLREMKQEYLTTANYQEINLKTHLLNKRFSTAFSTYEVSCIGFSIFCGYKRDSTIC